MTVKVVLTVICLWLMLTSLAKGQYFPDRSRNNFNPQLQPPGNPFTQPFHPQNFAPGSPSLGFNQNPPQTNLQNARQVPNFSPYPPPTFRSIPDHSSLFPQGSSSFPPLINQPNSFPPQTSVPYNPNFNPQRPNFPNPQQNNPFNHGAQGPSSIFNKPPQTSPFNPSTQGLGSMLSSPQPFNPFNRAAQGPGSIFNNPQQTNPFNRGAQGPGSIFNNPHQDNPFNRGAQGPGPVFNNPQQNNPFYRGAQDPGNIFTNPHPTDSSITRPQQVSPLSHPPTSLLSTPTEIFSPSTLRLIEEAIIPSFTGSHHSSPSYIRPQGTIPTSPDPQQIRPLNAQPTPQLSNPTEIFIPSTLRYHPINPAFTDSEHSIPSHIKPQNNILTSPSPSQTNTDPTTSQKLYQDSKGSQQSNLDSTIPQQTTTDSAVPQPVYSDSTIPQKTTPDSDVLQATDTDSIGPQNHASDSTVRQKPVSESIVPQPEDSAPQQPASDSTIPQKPISDSVVSQTEDSMSTVPQQPTTDSTIPPKPALDSGVLQPADSKSTVAQQPAPDSTVSQKPDLKPTVPQQIDSGSTSPQKTAAASDDVQPIASASEASSSVSAGSQDSGSVSSVPQQPIHNSHSRNSTTQYIPRSGQQTNYQASRDPLRGLRIVCLFNNRHFYRNGFTPAKLEPHLCTHLNYEFAILDPKSYEMIVGEPDLDIDMNFYEEAIALKRFNPKLKVLVSLGGWSDSTKKYSELASDPAKRANFVDKAIQFLLKHEFDGLDLAWEYPNCWQGAIGISPKDKANFVALLKDIKQGFKERGLLLSVSVGAIKREVEAAYDVPAISKIVDYINVMTYDMHGPWELVTGHHVQFEGKPGDKDPYCNVKGGIQVWAEKGCPRKKLNMGLALYGRTFTLQNPNQCGMGIPAVGPGNPGPVTKEGGIMNYHEICNFLNSGKWVEKEDSQAGFYACSDDGQWACYDPPVMIVRKAKYVVNSGLGGVLLKDLSGDDSDGDCFNMPFPILKMLKMEMVHKARRKYP